MPYVLIFLILPLYPSSHVTSSLTIDTLTCRISYYFLYFSSSQHLPSSFFQKSFCPSKCVTGVWFALWQPLCFPSFLFTSIFSLPCFTPCCYGLRVWLEQVCRIELAPGGIVSLLLTWSVLFCARSEKNAGSWTPHLFHPEAQSLCPPVPPSLLAQSSQRGNRLALPAPPCPTILQGYTTCKSSCQVPLHAYLLIHQFMGSWKHFHGSPNRQGGGRGNGFLTF